MLLVIAILLCTTFNSIACQSGRKFDQFQRPVMTVKLFCSMLMQKLFIGCCMVRIQRRYLVNAVTSANFAADLQQD
jgi:hypothetical protein